MEINDHVLRNANFQFELNKFALPCVGVYLENTLRKFAHHIREHIKLKGAVSRCLLADKCKQNLYCSAVKSDTRNRWSLKCPCLRAFAES